MSKAMPYKYDVEKCFLQQLVNYPELIMKLNIKSEHFYHKNFTKAFDCLKGMVERKESVNWVTFGSRFYDEKGLISELTGGDVIDGISFVTASTNLKILAEECAKRKILKSYNDLSDAPKKFIDEVKKIEIEFVTEKAESLLDLYDGYVKNYNERKKKMSDKGAVGLITGFKKIDKNCPFEKGEVVVLAARTSVGKTALALNIAINAAMFKQRVLFFSAEMTVNELLNRVMAQLTNVSATKFKYSNADHSLALAKNEIKVCGEYLKFIEASTLDSEAVCRISRQEVLPPDLIVVDYIQYLGDKAEKGETNNDRIGKITRNLKTVAKELGCTVLALSQVNRNTKGVPELHNLRDSGNIEQDSDIVLILHREDKEDVLADLVIAKNRNGEVIKTALRFNTKLTKFYE